MAVPAAVTAAAPYVGKAALAGAKATAAFAISTKVGVYARQQTVEALDQLRHSRNAARFAKEMNQTETLSEIA